MPVIMVENKYVLMEMIDSGYFFLYPHFRLVWLMDDESWMDTGPIVQSLNDLNTFDAGLPVDYV
ncbi:MAG: hypothetical protein AB7W47_12175 [Calditrichaceae bacterium]